MDTSIVNLSENRMGSRTPSDKELADSVPKTRLMSEQEWRKLGVQQSRGWIHYMIHEPEPHILLFRRPLQSKPPSQIEQINLRLILASGKSQEFTFAPSDSATDIAHYIFEHWPHEWADEAVPKAEILRLIYQGRFLHGNVTLGALQLPLGKTSVMHLVPRENLPEPNSQEQRQKCKERSNGCCNTVCTIL